MLEQPPGAPNHIKNPGLKAIGSLAKALDVPLQWLADGEGPEPVWGDEPSEDAAS